GLVLGDGWLALRRCGKRGDHILELRTATRFRRAECQRRAVMRDAVARAGLALDGDAPVFAA
ncbi:MAG TPA: hypothetical protein VEK37_03345, partial [Gemmatimonadaceae bacterium]|nr:hypothetical protein [Gemmatimonadaceae bacterium]